MRLQIARTPHSRTWSSSPTHRRREPRAPAAAGRLPLAHCFGGRRARWPFGDAQRFELLPPAPPPGDARRQWQPTGPALAGRVWRGGLRTEWATNAGFEGAVTHKTDKPELTLPKPAPGRYALRARSRNADGINSPLGPDPADRPARGAPALALADPGAGGPARAALSFAVALDAQRRPAAPAMAGLAGRLAAVGAAGRTGLAGAPDQLLSDTARWRPPPPPPCPPARCCAWTSTTPSLRLLREPLGRVAL